MTDNWHDAYGGWMPGSPSMYEHEEVWLTRAEWDGPKRMKVRDIHPMTNAIGLKWRPVADAEPLDRLLLQGMIDKHGRG